MTFDWTADAANGWTIPIGADLGKAFNLGTHAMGLQLGAYDLLKRPDGAPQWIIRLQVIPTALSNDLREGFPKARRYDSLRSSPNRR